MRTFLKAFFIMVLMIAGAFASEANHIRIFTTDNSDKKITPATVQAAFEKAGFVVEANNDMNAPFKRDFNNTHHDVYNLMVLWRKDTALALAEKYPSFGLFAPLSMSIYTKRGSKDISVSSLSTAGIASVTGIPADEKALVDLEKKIDEVLAAALPKGKFETVAYSMKDTKEPMVVTVDFALKGDDWEENKDNFDMAFDGKLAPNGFVSPAYVDLNYDFDEKSKDWYTFYGAYSICSIPVIYTVSEKHPEAGALAPCTMYFYMKKDDDKIHVGFPSVSKWISSMNIDDEKSIKILKEAEDKFKKILSEVTK